MHIPAITVESLSKKYVLGARHAAPKSFRDLISTTVSAPLRRLKELGGGAHAHEKAFWALDDVAFEVDEGQVVGVIGRNGAGKSTLLKIISRITEPTKGRIKIRGRVASLLEVGTGFHPELTGRENIYLNGGILGMTKREIGSKFDEIVDFSGVETFLDTPLKRFSSGMAVRLAFSVAAHLEPEILLIDEVLTVGDAEFQAKCLGKMHQVAGQGRTVLFVSHNLNAVERLCGRAIWLEGGKLMRDSDNVRRTISEYLNNAGMHGGRTAWSAGSQQKQNDYFVPKQLQIRSTDLNADGEAAFSNRFPISVSIEGDLRTDDKALNIGLALYDQDNNLLFWTFSTDAEHSRWPTLSPGPIRLRTEIPAKLLNEGAYRVELLASLHRRMWILSPGGDAPCVTFVVKGGLSDSPLWESKRPGILAPLLEWKSC